MLGWGGSGPDDAPRAACFARFICVLASCFRTPYKSRFTITSSHTGSGKRDSNDHRLAGLPFRHSFSYSCCILARMDRSSRSVSGIRLRLYFRLTFPFLFLSSISDPTERGRAMFRCVILVCWEGSGGGVNTIDRDDDTLPPLRRPRAHVDASREAGLLCSLRPAKLLSVMVKAVVDCAVNNQIWTDN